MFYCTSSFDSFLLWCKYGYFIVFLCEILLCILILFHHTYDHRIYFQFFTFFASFHFFSGHFLFYFLFNLFYFILFYFFYFVRTVVRSNFPSYGRNIWWILYSYCFEKSYYSFCYQCHYVKRAMGRIWKVNKEYSIIL